MIRFALIIVVGLMLSLNTGCSVMEKVGLGDTSRKGTLTATQLGTATVTAEKAEKVLKPLLDQAMIDYATLQQVTDVTANNLAEGIKDPALQSHHGWLSELKALAGAKVKDLSTRIEEAHNRVGTARDCSDLLSGLDAKAPKMHPANNKVLKDLEGLLLEATLQFESHAKTAGRGRNPIGISTQRHALMIAEADKEMERLTVVRAQTPWRLRVVEIAIAMKSSISMEWAAEDLLSYAAPTNPPSTPQPDNTGR